MNYIGKFITNFKEFYNEINSATLTGAIDVIVIKQPDNSYLCSPFHVRFGKLGVLRSKEKVVDIEINGESVEIHMKLGDNGEAFFVEQLPEEENGYDLPGYLATSPIPDSSLIASTIENELNRLKVKKMKSWGELSSDSVNFKRDFVDSKSSDYQTVPSSKLNGNESFLKKSDSNLTVSSNNLVSGKRRRRRRAGHTSRAHTPAKTTDDLLEDHPNQLDELSLYDDEFVVHSDDDLRDERDSRIEDNIDRFKSNVPRSNSRPISRTFTPPIQNSNTVINETNCHNSLKSINADFHPFSDGEMSHFPDDFPKKMFERPPSPKSDTEFEMSKADNAVAAETVDSSAEVSWQWGELPQVSRKVSAASHRSSQSNVSNSNVDSNLERKISPPTETRSGVLHNMFTLLKTEEKSKLNNKIIQSKEGIYLDDLDLKELDPEVAELYFPKLRSPMPLKRLSDDETESGKGSLPHSPPVSNENETENRIQTGLAADAVDHEKEKTKGVNEGNQTDDANQSLTDVLVSWPHIELSLCGEESDEDKFKENLVTFEQFSQDPSEILKNPNLVCRINGKCHSWPVAVCVLTSLLAYKQPLPDACIEILTQNHSQKKANQNKSSSWWSWRRSYAETQTSPNSKTAVLNDELTKSPSNRESISRIRLNNNDSSETDNEADDVCFDSNDSKGRKSHYRKVLRLNSKDIERLNLQNGANEAVFSVTTAYQGTSRCKCHVYLWNYDDKIIISDIDGTITKSDVLGHILPILGKDWAQSGVANLFTKIKDNGYKLLYLSARAIGQAEITREYLKSVRQGDLCLPDGPLLLSPTSLISAFHKEVFEKKPEEFKISCLKDIQALFPENPFYAGFGNKINDTWAYRAVEIPLSRIFTINHRGELKLELIQTFQSSYTRLSDVVDQMFPPLELKSKNDFLSEYSTFNYWRDSLPEVPIEEKSQIENKSETPTNSTNISTKLN